MKKKILLIPLSLTTLTGLHAQSIGPATNNAAGNTALISGNEYDWSVGEMALVSTFSNSSITITQGVLQPDKSSAGIAQESVARQLQVFPNPARSIVNIQYAATQGGALSYKLMDVQGRVIASHSVNIAPGNSTHQVDVSGLANATYMLQVMVSSGTAAPELISYKIEKIK